MKTPELLDGVGSVNAEPAPFACAGDIPHEFGAISGSSGLGPQSTLVNHQPKENLMELYHYLMQEEGGPLFRRIANLISVGQKEAYKMSQITKGVVTVKGTNTQIMAIDTGSWSFPLLIERACKMGVDFRVDSYDIKTVAPMGEEELANIVAKSNFFYASASNLVVFTFKGYGGFDLLPLGIVIENSKKLSKRNTELIRCSGFSYSGPIVTREFTTPEGDKDEYYDGGNVISRSFANKMSLGEDVTRVNLRVITPEGLVKGDAQIIPDLDVDVLYHTENLKTEFRSTDWFLATAIDHPPYHELRHDDQTRANFSFFLPEDQIEKDMGTLVKEWRKSIREGGELHDYLNNQSGAFDDPIAVDIDRIQMNRRLEEQAKLLKEVGLPSTVVSNIPFTRTGAMVRKMDAHAIKDERGRETKSFKKMFVPATNAFLGSVSTWEFCTKMCGMKFPGEDGTRVFFHYKVGLIIPGHRFADTYDLHGGWDGDDTLSMFAIKVYCSDGEKLDLLKRNGVIDASVQLGTEVTDATLMGLAIRRPNGPGEYSVEIISEDMPWAFGNESTVRVFDLADAPLPLGEVFANVMMQGIPTSVTYDGPFDRAFAFNMVLAQCQNPGVGPFANVMIAWACVFGPNNMPSEMLASMEDIIDTSQQTADAISFAAISDEVQRLWVLFVEEVIATGTKVDTGLFASRIPVQLGSGETAILIQQPIMDAKLAAPGPLRRLHATYSRGVKIMKKSAQELAGEARSNTAVAKRVKAMQFEPELIEWVVGWFGAFRSRINSLDNEYRAKVNKDDNILVVRQNQTNRRLALEAYMDDRTKSIVTNNRFDTHQQIMALYKVILSPLPEHPFGGIDRVFVQPSSQGEMSMLQLFISACAEYGFLPESTHIKWDPSIR